MRKINNMAAYLYLFIPVIFMLSITHVYGAEKSAAEFYKGKTVEFVIPFGVGGGTDRLSRMIITYFEKRLGCHLVPTNKTGAGGLIGLNYVWNAKKNGLSIGMAALNSAVWGEFIGSNAVRFETDKLNLIGGVEKQAQIISTRKDGPFKTYSELINSQKTILLGVPGKLSPMHVLVVLASDAWDFKVKVIPGYKGAAGMMKAVEGGEVDIVCNSEIPSKPRIEAGTIHPLAYVTTKRQQLFPDIPAITETPAKDKAALERFLSAIWVYRHERAIAMPPGVPQDRVAFVREALKDTLKDPGLIAEGKKNGIRIMFVDPGEYKKQISKLFKGMSEQDTAHVKKLVR